MNMSKQDKEKKSMTKDRLIGMQVIDSDGNASGTVQDIAFTVGKVGMTLIVETKKGETKEIAWEDIQAAGDYVVLRPAHPPTCPTCGGPLTYIQQYQRWYCYRDNKYV